MKLWVGMGLACLLLASLPARADTTSDLAQCEKTVKKKTGDIDAQNVSLCMQPLGYQMDADAQVDALTHCRDMQFPGIEVRCYRGEYPDIGHVPAPIAIDWQSRKIDELVAQEAAWSGKCRAGGPSRFYTEDICNQHDRLVMVLQARGLCRQLDPADLTETNAPWQSCRGETP